MGRLTASPEVLLAFREALGHATTLDEIPDDAISAKEFAQSLNVSDSRAQALLRHLVHAGRADRFLVRRPNSTRPAYYYRLTN